MQTESNGLANGDGLEKSINNMSLGNGPKMTYIPPNRRGQVGSSAPAPAAAAPAASYGARDARSKYHLRVFFLNFFSNP